MSDRYSYIGRCRGCGALCAAASDDIEDVKHVAKAVAEWIREGLIIEHVPSDVVRIEFSECQCFKEPKKKAKPLTLPEMR